MGAKSKSGFSVAMILITFANVMAEMAECTNTTDEFKNMDNQNTGIISQRCAVNWNLLASLVGPTPTNAEELGTTFVLSTRNCTQGEDIRVDNEGKISSKFYKADKNARFIIHGYMSRGKNPTSEEMTESILRREDANVIVVDWSNGARPPYSNAVSNAKIAGFEIAHLIKAIMENLGVSADKFHLIGHSLGSHVAGYAGKRIDGLGRITGLDPAGPLFTDVMSSDCLDKNDAKVVDVIHTDSGSCGYGNRQILGRINFFPNGGYRQPGCGFLESWKKHSLQGVIHALTCSHSRAAELFIDSINYSPFFEDEEGSGERNCAYIAFHCKSYEDFLGGTCVNCGANGENCALMGIDADEYLRRVEKSIQPRNFYLKTNAHSPFCGCHYGISLTIEGILSVWGGVLDLRGNLYGDKGVAMDMVFTKSNNGEHNFFGFSPNNTGHVSKADLTCRWLFGENSHCSVPRVEITNMCYHSSEHFLKSVLCYQKNITNGPVFTSNC